MIIERRAIRAILLTPEREVLLLRIHPPGGGASFWITPGGGLDPGEDRELGLRRELREEVGLVDFAMGPLLWRRQHTFDWAGKRIRQSEDLYLVEAPRFEPHMSDATELEVLEGFRWWSLEELARTSEPVTPRSLWEILTRYLAEGPPREPPEVEVLVD